MEQTSEQRPTAVTEVLADDIPFGFGAEPAQMVPAQQVEADEQWQREQPPPRVQRISPSEQRSPIDAFYEYCTPEIDHLVEALAVAQGKFGDVEREHEAEVKSRRTQSTFTYTYADLQAFLKAVRGPLSEQKIALFQLPRVGQRSVTVKTVIAHGNQRLWNYMTVPLDGGGPQEVGSALTYCKRYGVCALLGLSAGEKDDDGAAAQDASERRSAAPQPAQRRSQQPTGELETDLVVQGTITNKTQRADGMTAIKMSGGQRAFTRDPQVGAFLVGLDKDVEVRVRARVEPGSTVPVIVRVEAVNT